MSLRQNAVANYMSVLVSQYRVLEEEKQQLLNPKGRLAEIAAQQAELVEDAQAALVRYNAAHGTDYTLAQIRNKFKPATPAPTGPVVP
jgi:hypothetical protein